MMLGSRTSLCSILISMAFLVSNRMAIDDATKHNECVLFPFCIGCFEFNGEKLSSRGDTRYRWDRRDEHAPRTTRKSKRRTREEGEKVFGPYVYSWNVLRHIPFDTKHHWVFIFICLIDGGCCRAGWMCVSGIYRLRASNALITFTRLGPDRAGVSIRFRLQIEDRIKINEQIKLK